MWHGGRGRGCGKLGASREKSEAAERREYSGTYAASADAFPIADRGSLEETLLCGRTCRKKLNHSDLLKRMGSGLYSVNTARK